MDKSRLDPTSPRFRSASRRITVPASIVLLAAIALAGCGRSGARSLVAPTATGAPTASRAAGAARLESAGHLEGDLGPGARWSIDRPESWNGDLVVWLHGYTNPALPVALPAFGPVRDQFLARGYAVVASSYSENGYAIKEGILQSHQLRGLFVSQVGQPLHTYLVGVSLGGLVGALLTEKYPDQYSGSLLVSGIVGGSDDELTYVGDVRVLFDAVYPGVLPGSLLEVPEGTDVNAAIARAKAAISQNPQGLGIIAALARVKPEFSSGSELAQSVLTALGFQLQGANDILSRTRGHCFFDNQDWTYTGPVPQPVADQVNATVARYRSAPDAEEFVRIYGEPSGDLRIPVITMHNALDPVVPAYHEGLYAGAVSRHGADAFLVQRRVARYGHVAILPAEIAASFDDLAAWVNTGSRPAH